MTDSPPAIRLESITKRYGRVEAVSDLSIEIAQGQVVGFLGANGAGKSTTMRVLTGYFQPTSGTAQVMGRDVVRERREAQRLIGYLPELNPLYPEMAVVDFLGFVARARGVAAGDVEEALARVAGRCGLREVFARPIRQLSRGYRQRVGLAQAMVHDPPLLILDEPTTGLDPNQRAEILELIRELGREKTVLHSTHLLDEVRATCDRTVIIARGRLVAEGTPQEIVARHAAGDELRLVWHAPEAAAREALEALGGVEEVERMPEGDDGAAPAWRLALAKSAKIGENGRTDDPREAIFEVARRESWTILELTRIQAPIDGVFRRLMAG